MRWCAGGKRSFGPELRPSKLDNLTLGLERHASRNLYRLLTATARQARSRGGSPSGCPTAATRCSCPPWPRPTLEIAAWIRPPTTSRSSTGCWAGWRSRRCRNATGDPAIFCRAGPDRCGSPAGMMLSATRGREAPAVGTGLHELEEAPALGAHSRIRALAAWHANVRKAGNEQLAAEPSGEG